MHIACKSMSILACVATTLFAAGLQPSATAAPPVVWTQHNDNSRTGSNTAETILAPSDVDGTHFGKLISYSLDDQSFSQPLYIPGLTMPVDNQVHNVVYETTVNNTVYAFDADGQSATPLWMDRLSPTGQRPPNAQDMSNLGACGGTYRDFAGQFGIVGTPVIDTTTKTMYLVSRYVDIATASKFVQKLHALDITTGAEKFGGPVTITAVATDGTTFDSALNNQRTAVSLVNGVVYIGWSSHCDNGSYHGWIIGYKASSLAKVAQWSSTDATGSQGGIWMSGQGVTAISGSGNPNIYLMTGNGTWDGIKNFGESFVKFNTSSTGALTVADFFTPANWDSLNNQDNDLGSSGPLNIPGSSLLFGGGKQGMAYLVNAGNMGHENGSDNVVQEFQATAPRDGATGHIHGSPVYLDSFDANGNEAKYVYLWGENDFLHTYQFTPNGQLGVLSSSSVADSAQYAPETGTGMPGGFLSLSSNAGSDGIIWALTPFDGDANQDTRPGILYAYDAANFTGTGTTKALTKLWSSEDNSSRDTVGNYAKFTYPTIANGKVYVSSWADTYSGSGQLIIYGLISNPVPVISNLAPTGAVVGSAAYTLSVNGSNFVPGATVLWSGTALTTTFVSSTQLNAQVPASDIATVGVHAVTVVNPAPGGGVSPNSVNEKIVGISNLTTVTPLTAVVGAPALTLTVTGTAFNSGTTVEWDGADLTTTLVSPTKLTAALPATDLAVAGRYTITVSNGAPGSGTGSAIFTVTGLATFYGLVSRDFDSSPMPGVTVDLVDSQGTHFDATSSGFATTGLDSSPANFGITQLGAGTYTLTVSAPVGITIPTLPTTVTIPATGGLRQDVVITAVHTFPAGLQMFSVPDDYQGAAATVLLAGLGTSNIATWDASAFAYALNPNPPANTLTRGRGYWVRATTGLGLYGAHPASDASVPVSFPLTAGWNMIGDPFDTDISISDLRSGDVNNQFPAEQLISPTIYGYDATSNQYVVAANGTLTEYVGYWVYALKNGNLIFNAPH